MKCDAALHARWITNSFILFIVFLLMPVLLLFDNEKPVLAKRFDRISFPLLAKVMNLVSVVKGNNIFLNYSK